MLSSFESIGWAIALICFALAIVSFIRLIIAQKSLSEFNKLSEKEEVTAKELSEKKAINESIIYFSQSLFRQNTVEDILWDVTSNCIKNLGFVDCVIYLKDSSRDVLVQKAAFGPKDGGNHHIASPIEFPIHKGIVGAAYTSGKHQLIHDVRLDERYILDDEQRLSELAVPIVSPDGKVLGVIDSEHPEKAFFTNIHLEVLNTIASICAIKLIKAEADKIILEAKLEAEKATKAKSQFLTTISHEIRTPLNAIIGSSHLLLNETLEESQREDLSNLHLSANHLLSLVNDILDFSKLESKKLLFEQVEFNLLEVCTDLVKTHKTEALNKNLVLGLDAPAISMNFVGDKARLTQVFTNLISNAIKFSESGKITVSYGILSQSSTSVKVRFSVQDEGIGIPKEKLEEVFKHFEQVSNSTNRAYGGSGLGLAISKKLVELQGGNIGVKSQLGQGSEFWFELTFGIGSKIATNSVTDKETWSKESLTGLRVLYAEDNNINSLIGSKFLKKWNAEYAIAENGKVAITKLEEGNSFDVILMDINMPIMDGKEATLAIRNSSNSAYNKIPIIALTADASPQAHEEALAAGMNGYLSKPFDPQKLFQVLKKFQPTSD